MSNLISQQRLMSWVRKLAENAATPSFLLKYLAFHGDTGVRFAVAENKSTPEEALLLLADDVNPDIRYMLAENHNLPLVVLKRLTDDENPYVSFRARKTIDRLLRESVVLDTPFYCQPLEQTAFGG